MVTIKDVAKDAGVSVGTVSNVINGGRVSKEKKNLVMRSIKKLDYQINALAKGMRTQKTDYVVVILPNLINPYFALLLDALEAELSEVGKRPILCLSNDEEEREVNFIEMAKCSKVDGIIGITYSQIDKYLTDDIAFVSIDRHYRSRVTCVACDNKKGGWLAAENLHKRGAKNLLSFQTVSSMDSEVRKRKNGFEEYCMEHGIPYSCTELSERQVYSLYSSYGSGNLIGKVLKAYVGENESEESVDGIFASSDHLAVVIKEELERMGKRVPEDVQIIGFDGLRFLNQGQPVVSSIAQPIREIARQSVSCLTEILQTGKAESVTDLPVQFQEGFTTKGLPEGEVENV